MAERKITKKDIGIYYCYKGYKSNFKKQHYYHMTDLQDGGSTIVMHDQNDKSLGISPLFLRQHFQKITLWNGPNGMQLQVLGDPREYETTEMHLVDKDGKLLADWSQDWTEFDDSGKKMHYGEYAPWTEHFLYDIIDAGCEDIPDGVDLTEFKPYQPKDGEFPK